MTKAGESIELQDLGSTNGTYCNGQRVQRQLLAEGDKILLGSTTILKFSYQDKLDEMFQRQMSESALRDGLTRAYNKRYFIDRIDTELQYAVRHGAPLALIFLDIDHFKKINDSHGHPAGDHVLTQLATLVDEHAGRRRDAGPLRRRGVRDPVARDRAGRRRGAVRAPARGDRGPSASPSAGRPSR